ncbi:MAG: DNA polymerase III subunit chi [Alphaproteobacteria bacterium]
MTEIGFYHLRALPLERALPRLLEKALERGHRALVLAESSERVAALDAALWTYDPASFLPHGTAAGPSPERQPILIAERPDNRNDADLLVLVGGIDVADLGAFARCLDLFDGNDDSAVAAARERWQRRKAEGHALTYWQQSETGQWQEKQ